MKTTVLSELLNDEQIKMVTKILNRKDTPDTLKTSELKLYLEKYRVELEAKGVLPEYLSYVLIAKHQQIT